jgi:S-adenosylmethionine hydrolase
VSRIVTFTTDFGLQDHYVGTMKGVVLNINPEAHLVDISHSVPSPKPIATFLLKPFTWWWLILEWARRAGPSW